MHVTGKLGSINLNYKLQRNSAKHILGVTFSAMLIRPNHQPGTCDSNQWDALPWVSGQLIHALQWRQELEQREPSNQDDRQ